MNMIRIGEDKALILNIGLQQFEVINIKSFQYEAVIKGYNIENGFVMASQHPLIKKDDKRLLCTAYNGYLLEVDIITYKVRKIKRLHKEYIRALCLYTDNNNNTIICSSGNTFKVWSY